MERIVDFEKIDPQIVNIIENNQITATDENNDMIMI